MRYARDTHATHAMTACVSHSEAAIGASNAPDGGYARVRARDAVVDRVREFQRDGAGLDPTHATARDGSLILSCSEKEGSIGQGRLCVGPRASACVRLSDTDRARIAADIRHAAWERAWHEGDKSDADADGVRVARAGEAQR